MKMAPIRETSIRGKIVFLVPLIIFLVLYRVAKEIPSEIRPKPDVITLPTLDKLILGGRMLQRFPKTIMDVGKWKTLFNMLDILAAGVYLVHYVVAAIFVICIIFYFNNERKKMHGWSSVYPWSFVWCFGLMNTLAVITQVVWPTAAPWYNEMYGTQDATYDVRSSPADLKNIDELFNVEFFSAIYGQNPIPFGAFPSLHAAWPMLIAIFAPTKKLQYVLWVYALTAAWAALYLNHHFLTDVIGAICYSFGSYLIGIRYLHLQESRFYSWICGKHDKQTKKVAELEELKIHPN